MYNTKFVQKLAFAYRNCPLSRETTKHFQAYINSLLCSGIENLPKCAVYDIVSTEICYLSDASRHYDDDDDDDDFCRLRYV